MIVYYEYFPHDYINLPTVVAAFEAWQDIYEQVSPTLWPAFLAYTNDSNCDEDADDLPIPSRFLEAHMGEYESFDDYLYNNLAGDLIEEVNSCPEVVQRYFSWQSYIADAKYDYTVLPAPGSGYFVFRNLERHRKVPLPSPQRGSSAHPAVFTFFCTLTHSSRYRAVSGFRRSHGR